MTIYRDRQEAGEYEALPDLDQMTKAELQEEAARRGIDVAESWAKADIREAIEAG